jgi:hypothetical protein
LGGVIGWEPPKKEGAAEQPRITEARVDISRALDDSVVDGVLSRWLEARMHVESSPYMGGVLDGWPGVDVDGFAICREEEFHIDSFVRWKERK